MRYGFVHCVGIGMDSILCSREMDQRSSGFLSVRVVMRSSTLDSSTCDEVAVPSRSPYLYLVVSLLKTISKEQTSGVFPLSTLRGDFCPNVKKSAHSLINDTRLIGDEHVTDRGFIINPIGRFFLLFRLGNDMSVQ